MKTLKGEEGGLARNLGIQEMTWQPIFWVSLCCLSIFWTGCWRSTQPRNASEYWFLKKPKRCLLSFTNGSGNGYSNKTETFFYSNCLTLAKHCGLSHYCQQWLSAKHWHPHSHNSDKMPGHAHTLISYWPQIWDTKSLSSGEILELFIWIQLSSEYS